MEHKRTFSNRSLLFVLIFNAAILALGALTMQGNLLVFLGGGLAMTSLLWVMLNKVGTDLIGAAEAQQAVVASPEPAPQLPPEPKRPEKPQLPREASAIQLLGILQRKGRLIDFLQEDLRAYGDADIGAAARRVHEDTKEALAEIVTLEPIMSDGEGNAVTLKEGFDTQAIRVTGNVSGTPPFKGVLAHKGWRVKSIDLPEIMQAQQHVIAPAEVEIG